VAVRRYALAPPAVATVDGAPIDLKAANAAAFEHLRPTSRVLIVPGYTPVNTKAPIRLHPTAAARLDHAVNRLRAGEADFILVSGGNVHPSEPEPTPFNEGWEMRRWLLHERHLDGAQVLLEPYARHSTTNLRNAGRLLRSRGVLSAEVITDSGQGFYFGLPLLSSFTLRCIAELGYSVGELEPLELDFTRVRFSPSPKVWNRGKDPKDP